jgi:hypothetical protein
VNILTRGGQRAVKRKTSRRKLVPKPAYNYQTFAVIRSYNGRIYVARIKTARRLTGRGTKQGALKYALKFKRRSAKIDYFALGKTWDQAQKLDIADIKNLIRGKKPAGFDFNAAIALYQLKMRRGQDAISPAFAPIGESKKTTTRKVIPRKRKRI